MALSLKIGAEDLRGVMENMERDRDEQVSFLFATFANDAEDLDVVETYHVPADGFLRQSPYHLALTDETRVLVLGRATGLGACLVEAHSHQPGTDVWFSPTDLEGFEDWVPQVRWRLGGRPYVALVFAGASFDALAWTGDTTEPGPLAGLVVDGERHKPTGITWRLIGGTQDGR
jgi:hypothetical protein